MVDDGVRFWGCRVEGDTGAEDGAHDEPEERDVCFGRRERLRRGLGIRGNGSRVRLLMVDDSGCRVLSVSGGENVCEEGGFRG